LPGDNAEPIPSDGSGKRSAEAKFGASYEKIDWWKTGTPTPEITDWTDAEKATADLVLQSFSLDSSTCEIGSGYQDYRMSATYLDQIYPNIKTTDIITILYPRSPEMKESNELPLITNLSDESSVALKIERAGKQHLIAARGSDGKAVVGELSADADFASVALDAEGNIAGFIMVKGQQLSFGEAFSLTVDAPLLAVASYEAGRVKIVFDTQVPSGADLRVKLPQVPHAVLFNGENAFASLTPKNHLAEFHIPSGRTEVIVELLTEKRK
jgi:hypothetical protein